MPPNRMACIRRKCYYLHHKLTNAMRHLADLHATVAPAHPDAAELVKEQLYSLDRQREQVVYLYRLLWSGTEKPFRQDPPAHEILTAGVPVRDPKHRQHKSV